MTKIYHGIATLFEGYESLTIGDLLLFSRSQQEAIDFNEPLYFTGICQNGHLALRDTKTKKCIKCNKVTYEKWLQNGGLEKRAEYQKDSYSIPKNKAIKSARNQLYRTLEYARLKKYGKTFDILGYTPEEFRAHIEGLFCDGMSWENYGYLWEIDHIEPLATYTYETMKDVAYANRLTNLTPIFKADHKIKTALDMVRIRLNSGVAS